MNIIKENPYRTVGLLVGASARERERQIKRLKQFIEAEQEPQDDFSFPILGNLHRTVEKVDEAASKLNLDTDKMNAALFWFYKGNPITDEPAFDACNEGDFDQALTIWSKLTSTVEVTSRNASAFSNLSTLYLSGALDGATTKEEMVEQGVSLKLKFLESDLIKDFKALATDETFKTTKKELQILFLNQLQSEIENNKLVSSNKFLEILTKQQFSAKEDFLKGFVQKPIEQIERLINECKSHRKTKKEEVIVAGTKLYNSAKPILVQLKGILGNSNLRYTSVSDKVSEEILQCGIQLFNDYKDHKTYDPGEPAMKLFTQAKALAIGNIVKQRCQENTDNLQEWINDKPERDLHKKIGDDFKFIIEQINLAADTLKNNGKYPKGYNDPYSDLPLNEQPHNKIISQNSLDFDSHIPFSALSPFSENKYNINLFRLSRDIVKKCKSRLDKIKLELGSTNEIYQKLSNDVATLALACLIEYVNASSKSHLGIPPSISEHEINSMNAIGDLDMSLETRKRYNEQKQSLNNLHKAVQRRTTQATSSSSSSSGCYIATMAYGSYDHPQVMILRKFRDNNLEKTSLGRKLIKSYYYYSPRLVEKLKNRKLANSIIRSILNQFIKLLNK